MVYASEWIFFVKVNSPGDIFGYFFGGFNSIGIYFGLPPTQDSSHHQDCYVFGRGSHPKLSFALLLGGDNPRYYSV